MSVFVPTGAAVAVDPLDVLLVAPNGTTSTTLYLAQGQPVVIAALPGDVIDELNTAAGLTEGSMFTTPVTASEWPSPIYIAGAQVKRVQSSGATQAGSMVLFALSGFMVTVPTVDLSDMVDLINATTTGGGPALPSVQTWQPTFQPFGCSVVDPGTWEAVRIPPGGDEGTPYWLISGQFSIQALNTQLPRVDIGGFQSVIGAPVPFGQAGVNVQMRNGDDPITGGTADMWSLHSASDNTVTARSTTIWTADEQLQLSCLIAYREALS